MRLKDILTLLTLSASMVAHANCKKPIRIAILDTGIGFDGYGIHAKFCQKGHRDFTDEQVFMKLKDVEDPIPVDGHGHGTNIAGIIEKYASIQNDNYCLIIIKFISVDMRNQLASENAINYLKSLKPDIANYSGGGDGYNPVEALGIRKYLDRNGIFVAAAGNEGKNLDDKNTVGYYPAMYDKRIIVVGAAKNDHRYVFSNYGSMVKFWEEGFEVEGYGLKFSGTSQATAIATGKIVGQLNEKCVR